MKSISKIEQSIVESSKIEARKKWEELHAPVVKSFKELLGYLPRGHYKRVILGSRSRTSLDETLSAVIFDGKSSGKGDNIPSGFCEACVVNRVEFTPDFLEERLEEEWIAKETSRIAETKIKHLLSVAGVA